jgi:energy-coupling factor transporter ATP-binding protein EcfA2
MTLRADAIKLPATGPLGAVSINALEKFDLIVITGPNASGKSTLIAPLGTPNSENGTVSCIDDKNNANVPYEAKGVQQSITFITSTELMTKFRDLNQALALAAGTTRLLHEQRLLARVRKDLLQNNEDLNGEPPELNYLSHQYLQADRNCRDLPRTDAKYNQIGKRLAVRACVPWENLDLGAPDDVRTGAESLLHPKARTIPGFFELIPSLTALKSLPVPTAVGANGASCLHTATVALTDAIHHAHATILIQSEAAPNAIQEIARNSEDVAGKLLSASKNIKDVLDAKNVLRECRIRALAYLEKQDASSCPTEKCPVCDGKINSAELQRSLNALGADEDAEGQQLQKKLNAITKAHESLTLKLTEFTSATHQARTEHKQILDAINRNVRDLRPVIDSNEAVVGSAKVLKDSCESWTKNHMAPSIEAIKAAQELAKLAAKEFETLQSKNHALNANLREAESDFTDLRLLGVALAARHKLDNLRWDASLDQFDANRRRKAQRDRWLEVLKTMASEREAGASTAESTVVTDPGVQERFNRLLDLLKYHTGLQTLKFCGKEVQLNGVAASNTLSEGQTVLVNIAATIAVVGKVAGTAEHRPGWIVFDEPTNGLDEEGRNQVAEYLGGLSITDVPSQIVVATFDTKFAEKLITKATATGRRGKHVELQDFKPGSTVQPKIREF